MCTSVTLLNLVKFLIALSRLISLPNAGEFYGYPCSNTPITRQTSETLLKYFISSIKIILDCASHFHSVMCVSLPFIFFLSPRGYLTLFPISVNSSLNCPNFALHRKARSVPPYYLRLQLSNKSTCTRSTWSQHWSSFSSS